MIPGKIFSSRSGKYTWRVATVGFLLATAALLPAWNHLVGLSVAPLSSAPPDMAALPLSFEPNAGQTDPSVSFMAHTPGSTFYFTDSEVVIALQTGTATGKRGLASLVSAQSSSVPEPRPPAPSEPSVLRLQFIGATVDQVTSEGNALPGRVNYIRGKDKAKWHTNIATYPSITYENLYPGIGLHYSGKGGLLKGTYVISPHADPSKIRWRYDGAQSTTLDDEDRLRIELGASDGQPTQIPSPCPLQFTDVPPGSTFYPFVRCLACRGVLGGYSDGTFRPGSNVTRGQIAKIVSNAAGFNEPANGQTFEDVEPDNTFYVYVERMAGRGIIGGYPCGGAGEPCCTGNKPYFRPNANATRGQISKIVSESAGFSDPQAGQTFEDVPSTNTFYVWIERLASRGIMSGYPCGGEGEPCGPKNRPYFRWGNNATRGQTAKIVSNTFFPTCQAP